MITRISFDADGVVIRDQGVLFIDYVKGVLKLPFDDEKFGPLHNWQEAMGIEKAKIEKLYLEYLVDGPQPQFMPGAEQCLFAISQIAPIHINTARPSEAARPVIDLLSSAGIYCEEVHAGMHLTKHLPLQRHGIEWHVEDSCQEIQGILDQHDRAHILQFPSFATGKASQPIQHDRVRVLEGFEKSTEDSWDATIERYWSATVAHFRFLHAIV